MWGVPVGARFPPSTIGVLQTLSLGEIHVPALNKLPLGRALVARFPHKNSWFTQVVGVKCHYYAYLVGLGLCSSSGARVLGCQ